MHVVVYFLSGCTFNSINLVAVWHMLLVLGLILFLFVLTTTGILQVLFAAGYLGVLIQQDHAPGYDTLLNPCPCEEQHDLPVLHVMCSG